MNVFILLEGECHHQRVMGCYSTLEQADALAVSRRDASEYYEASIVLSVIDADPGPQWLVRVYSGTWLCSFYNHEPMRDYALPETTC